MPAVSRSRQFVGPVSTRAAEAPSSPSRRNEAITCPVFMKSRSIISIFIYGPLCCGSKRRLYRPSLLDFRRASKKERNLFWISTSCENYPSRLTRRSSSSFWTAWEGCLWTHQARRSSRLRTLRTSTTSPPGRTRRALRTRRRLRPRRERPGGPRELRHQRRFGQDLGPEGRSHPHRERRGARRTPKREAEPRRRRGLRRAREGVQGRRRFQGRGAL